jgi:hypothetical protein
MKKIIIGIVAVAMLAIPSVASAGVPRCEASVTTGTTIKIATFTVNQPRGSVGQFNDVWKHDFKVTVNADDTFTGTGTVTDGVGGAVAWTESITGKFGVNTITFNTVPNEGATFSVTDAQYNTPVLAQSTWTQNIIEFIISTPVISETTTPGTEPVKNHGQYVKAQGGGKIAAQACAGMPLNSSQGKS